MKLFQWAVAAAVILTQSVPDAPLLADETTDSINSLKQKIEQLDQKLDQHRQETQDGFAAAHRVIGGISHTLADHEVRIKALEGE